MKLYTFTAPSKPLKPLIRPRSKREWRTIALCAIAAVMIMLPTMIWMDHQLTQAENQMHVLQQLLHQNPKDTR